MTESSHSLAGSKILVADDESFSLIIVVRMLRELGYPDPLTAESGARTLSLFQQQTRDSLNLAIIDFNMPDINGLQILKLIRTGQTGMPRDLPVVMLTGTADGGLVTAAAALDVGAFVVKPVSKATLSLRIAKALGERRPPKAVTAYEAVDIDSVIRAVLASHTPNDSAKTRRPKADLSNAVKVPLEAVQVGAVLADDIRGPDGELLLGRGTALSERFLRRLQGLSGIAQIDYLMIEQPKKNAPP